MQTRNTLLVWACHLSICRSISLVCLSVCPPHLNTHCPFNSGLGFLISVRLTFPAKISRFTNRLSLFIHICLQRNRPQLTNVLTKMSVFFGFKLNVKTFLVGFEGLAITLVQMFAQQGSLAACEIQYFMHEEISEIFLMCVSREFGTCRKEER